MHKREHLESVRGSQAQIFLTPFRNTLASLPSLTVDKNKGGEKCTLHSMPETLCHDIIARGTHVLVSLAVLPHNYMFRRHILDLA